ncbi:hypothetical protein F5144DRAFT_594053 [Chaetomium tenue]|uniref:Uncharacterized protein n=1 Tax=Chaetomium tenue TaxID=1854479 RepID=A0ACB7P429_9PEZI|nr:hypothetical protein F5144DRAFT_594053 [Chaetomium globosum]
MGFVISHPPLDPTPTADAGAQPSQVLTILETVSHKPKDEGGGPVVVRCSLNSERSTIYIAKIYDGFQYALAEPGESGCDCMYLADMHYSREAAAYESIPARFQGSISLPTGASTANGFHRAGWWRTIPFSLLPDGWSTGGWVPQIPAAI